MTETIAAVALGHHMQPDQLRDFDGLRWSCVSCWRSAVSLQGERVRARCRILLPGEDGMSADEVVSRLKEDCRVEGCGRSRAPRSSLCQMHLARWRRTRDLGPPEPKFIRGDDHRRFWQKVLLSPHCWLWMGGKDDDGYGTFALRRTNSRAHRYSYELLVGPIPAGLTLDHLCRTPACVNPAHLEPVTAGENSLRGRGPAAVNARRTHCKHGHAFDEKNTYWYPGGRGRGCRICAARAQSEYERRKKAS